MILKYSLPVFCFLLAGYSCTSGHKEKRTSTATETTCTDPMYTVLIHADSIHATLLQKNKVGNQPTSGKYSGTGQQYCHQPNVHPSG